MDEKLLLKPLDFPRKGWKEKFEKTGGIDQALNEEEQEWIDALLAAAADFFIS